MDMSQKKYAEYKNAIKASFNDIGMAILEIAERLTHCENNQKILLAALAKLEEEKDTSESHHSYKSLKNPPKSKKASN